VTRLLLVAALAGVLSLGVASSSAQQTASVAIGDNFYDPATISVDAGTTVTWTNGGTQMHTVTSTRGLFDSGFTLSPGSSYSFTFSEAGTYNYYCQVHGVSQLGTVVVEGETPAPTEAPTPEPTAPPPQTPEPTPSAEPTPTPPSETPAASVTATATPSPTPGSQTPAGPASVTPTPSAAASADSTGDGAAFPVWLVILVAFLASAGSASALVYFGRRR